MQCLKQLAGPADAGVTGLPGPGQESQQQREIPSVSHQAELDELGAKRSALTNEVLIDAWQEMVAFVRASYPNYCYITSSENSV